MMGIKVREFAPLVNVSVEGLVPKDHFYRHLGRTLDLTFVHDLVLPRYAAGGRPSIDPIVFFRLQLILFFEGIRSERQLMRVAVVSGVSTPKLKRACVDVLGNRTLGIRAMSRNVEAMVSLRV